MRCILLKLIQHNSKLQQYIVMEASWIQAGLLAYLQQFILKGIPMHIAGFCTMKNTAVMLFVQG